ncbi:MAG: DUF4364 family protein [Lachnospiraceae bacterium]|nr:DUF4364 family protein [Lachnospiraceae bacterium]
MYEAFTVYKLIILYALDRAEGDVTQPMLSTFLLESGYANFVSLAESFDQLEKQGLVRVYMEGDKRFMHLTDAGRETLGFFGMQLSSGIRDQVDRWLAENGRRIREDRDVRAVYERMTSGVYEVRMSVREKDRTLLEVKIAVPDAASAAAIADKWKEKNSDIYQYLIENLF